MNDPVLIVTIVSGAAALAALGRSLWHGWKFEWHSHHHDGQG